MSLIAVLNRARISQAQGDVRSLGKMIKRVRDPIIKGELLVLLAAEVAFQNRNKKQAMRLMQMATHLATGSDEYELLLRRRAQKEVVQEIVDNVFEVVQAYRHARQETLDIIGESFPSDPHS